MTDTIGVVLQAQDQQFISSSKQAAAAVGQIADQEKKLAAEAEKLGVDGKKFAQEFAKVEAARVRDQQKGARAAELGQKKAASEEEKKAKAAETAAKKRAKDKTEYDKKYREASKAELAEGLAIAGETLAIGAAAVGAVAAFVAVAVAISDVALKAAEAKSNAKEFFNVLTAGRGDNLLSSVDKLATQLGVKLEDARQDFIKFRQAGLDNKQSAALLKLKADLTAVDHSGALAAEAVQRTLSFTANGTQTADQAAASVKQMALLAKQAGVAGNGTTAAAEAASTLVGAFNRLDNTKTKVLEDIGERIKPSIDKAATAVANMVEKFVASEKGKQAIDLVVKAITAMADIVTEATPYVIQLGSELEAAADNPTVKTALGGIKVLLIAAAVSVAALAAGAALLLAPMYAVGAAGLYVLGVFSDLVASAEGFGKNIIGGLIAGLKSGAGDIGKTISAMATNIKKTFTDALGIHSPSKIFEGFGVNIGAGAERGVDRSMPTGAELASRMTPQAQQVQQATAQAQGGASYQPPGSGSGGSGLHIDSLVVQVQGSTDMGPDELERSVRRAMDQWWSSKQQQLTGTG